MKKIGLVLLTTVLVACGQNSTPQSKKQEQLILGSWVIDKADVNYGKKGGIITYHEDGVMVYHGYKTAECKTLTTEVKGKWSINNNKLTIEIANDGQATTIVDDIISLESNTMTLKSSDGATLYRAKSSSCL